MGQHTFSLSGAGAVVLEPSEGAPGWIRWTLLQYRLPSTRAAERRRIWNLLRSRDALLLQPGSWAVAHDEHDRADLGPVEERLRALDGAWSMQEVGRHGPGDVEYQTRLWRACEGIWDGFFHDVDRLASPPGDATAEWLAEALQRLREDYGRHLVRDVVLTDAATRAARRLTELTTRLVDGAGPHEASVPGATHRTDPADPADRTSNRPRRSVEVLASRRLDDGSVRVLTQVTPLPTAAWDLALASFEACVYRPHASLVPLVHGTWTFTCPAHEITERVAALRRRVHTFELTLG